MDFKDLTSRSMRGARRLRDLDRAATRKAGLGDLLAVTAPYATQCSSAARSLEERTVRSTPDQRMSRRGRRPRGVHAREASSASASVGTSARASQAPMVRHRAASESWRGCGSTSRAAQSARSIAFLLQCDRVRSRRDQPGACANAPDQDVLRRSWRNRRVMERGASRQPRCGRA